MIRAAIVEDDGTERARIRECLDWLAQSEGISFQISEYPTGAAFLGAYQPEFDIVFMDIDMPGIDGMETARALRRYDPSVILIFVTNMAQYAISGYEVEALDFILKPINKYSFAIKVKRAAARVARRAEEFIPVKSEGETRSVQVSSIRYLDVNGHYVVYHTTQGDLEEYVTLKEAYGRLNRTCFVFCSRSCLVNLHHVNSVSKDSVWVGETRLDISRPQRKVFLQAVSDYMGGKR